MTRALLDINVLLALLDSDHVDHNRTQDWLETGIDDGWASCAITQNGFVRIISQTRYPSPISTADAVELLSHTCNNGSHEFWTCEISLLDGGLVDRSRLYSPRQVTDSYLLALAVSHGGVFVTFDRSLSLASVRSATKDHLLVL